MWSIYNSDNLDNPDILRNLVFLSNKWSLFGQDIISADNDNKAFITLLTQCEREEFPKLNFDPTDLKEPYRHTHTHTHIYIFIFKRNNYNIFKTSQQYIYL